MLIDPEKVTLRIGATDQSYLNIDYDGREIGYVKHTAAGHRVWTYDLSDRPLADFVEQCLRYA